MNRPERSRDNNLRDQLATALRFSPGQKIVRRNDKIQFRCPRHEDHTPSAWLGEYRWGCFACGFEEPLETLCEHLNVPVPATGLTVEQYAEMKVFSLANLAKWGVRTGLSDKGDTVVVIPYHDRDGKVLRNKLRGPHGSWWEGRGKPTYLYGLDILAKAPTTLPIIVVEGESDCHAAWHHGVLAVGVPGANGWRSEWAQYLTGRDVFVWQEPDDGGTHLARAVTGSLPTAKVIQPVRIKDLADLHREQGSGFRTAVEQLLARARGIEPPKASPIKIVKGDELPDFAERTRRQVRAGTDLIHADYSQCVHLPWVSLSNVIGHGLLPYQLWTLAAASGHGKTTAAMNLVKAWVEMGKRVYFVPLEQPTDVMRVYLAALRLGLSTKLALAHRWKDLPPSAQGAIESDLVEQENEAELLHFSDVDFLTVSGVPNVLEEAAAFKADVILIDHVHNIRSEGRSAIAEFVQVCQTLYNFSKNRRIPIVAMAQLHRGLVRDRLRPYLPPDVETIHMGDVLRQVSSVVMGLFRPLAYWVTAKDRAKIRLGEPVGQYLKPNTMGISVLKSRINGEDCGGIVELEYDRGHIRDRSMEDV